MIITIFVNNNYMEMKHDVFTLKSSVVYDDYLWFIFENQK